MSTSAITDSLVIHAPTRAVFVTDNARGTQRQGFTVCSTAPIPRIAERKHNGRTIYSLPAAPRGGYRCLVVYDTQQWGMRWAESGEHEQGPRPVPGIVVADDLVRVWARSTIAAPAGYQLGIGIIAGEEPTEKELALLLEQTRACGEWLISDGHDKMAKGERNNITNIHRLFAEWMYGSGAQRIPWYQRMDLADVKACVACAETIDANALRCKHCSTDLPDFYKKYNIPPDAACQRISDAALPLPTALPLIPRKA